MSALPTYTSGTPMTVAELPERMRPFLAHTAPVAARSRAAGGALPLPPDELVPVLLFLSQDPDEAVRKKAADSLIAMPEDLLASALQHLSTVTALDAAARVLRKVEKLARDIALNPKTADDTVRWLAGVAGLGVCDAIGRNQVRALRYPAIVEALYLNPKAAQGVVQGLLELAVRSDLPLDHIPGFREMKSLVAGEEQDEEGQKGLSDTEFALAMAWATSSYEREHGSTLAQLTPEQQEAEDARGKTLQALIQRMSVSQKIRLAMVGDGNVRKLLIRDPKKLVAMAVLRSPRITEGEVTTFASNKTLPEELLNMICRNRNWVKDYPTRKALIFNPKTPIAFSLQFIRSLNPKDLKDAAQSRDVNQTVQRTARRMIAEKLNN